MDHRKNNLIPTLEAFEKIPSAPFIEFGKHIIDYNHRFIIHFFNSTLLRYPKRKRSYTLLPL
jgi:hypothetical protein